MMREGGKIIDRNIARKQQNPIYIYFMSASSLKWKNTFCLSRTINYEKTTAAAFAAWSLLNLLHKSPPPLVNGTLPTGPL